MKRVVLVRPAGPRNVGMVLRATANFAPCELWLVAPERPSLLVHPEFEQMAHGVERAVERCRIVATLAEALADATRSFGFTARGRGDRRRAVWSARAGEAGRWAAREEELVALVFGNEVTGLAGEEADLCQELVHVPTAAEHTSLNLALCAGIALASLAVEAPLADEVAPVERGGKPLDGRGREYLKRHLAHVLAGEIVWSEAARRDVLAMIERVFSRAPLCDADARAWHLVLRTLGSERTPPDFGLDLSEKAGRRSAALEKALEKAARLRERGG
jgi:TrmH family RNA methyltransferase